MRVEIWSDLVCPWCYIGINRFERALAEFAHREDVEVVHRSFELDPSREPGATEPVEKMLTDKFGARGEGMDGQVGELARGEGLDYRSDREVGSTLDAHRLLHLAKARGLQHELVRRLFRWHFGEAGSVFDREVLAEVAAEVGLDADEARAVLADPDAHLADVRADEREASQLGASGVPFFVLDRRYGVSGAQPEETFRQALETAWADGR
ncbi:DsbA family oxidoreductase [Saccharothrix obliqua]|uniref:DsbA family oxidoreductase n=1 Tax=Saccharothrix obliqua TaxID=2861747 RepID=UPI001C5F52FC|nr:DsbA family oxidoreductase [Saccharothrix obliqua]MBW4718557.1 DsbA family oxidoreductase [Saccharothrix obliqua]